jgi:non-ribosomal peptide synthetase component F
MSHRGIQRIAGDLVDVVVGRGAFPSVVTLNAPIFFDGSIKQICWMAGGASMVIVPDAARQDPEVLFEFLLAERVDLMDCTPALLEMFSLLVGIDELPAGMRVLIGGEAIGPRLWNELRGSGLEAYNLYGPTETNAITAIRIAESAEPVIGQPLPGYVVHIVDESGAVAPVGAVGELVATGAGVARGYRNRPGLTAQRFVGAIESAPGQRSYRTGDLCRRRADGLIEFLGRRDSQVKLRGYRIELAEVEAAVARMPGVSACVVVLRETPAGDKRLVGYVVSASSVPEADMIDELRQELPDYMVPARLVRMELLPLTRNGKIDRAALP